MISFLCEAGFYKHMAPEDPGVPAGPRRESPDKHQGPTTGAPTADAPTTGTPAAAAPSAEGTSPETAGDPDRFARAFYYGGPFLVPVIVTALTYLFYPVTSPAFRWLPLLFVYWGTIWAFTLVYRHARGGVFVPGRFEPTLALRGKYRALQYLVVYGPLTYAVPLWVIQYVVPGVLSPAMLGAILVASVVNGPSEEVYWRACLEDAGTAAGASARRRLALTPVMFALWHTAFVIHLFPWDETWWGWWTAVVAMTWTSGLAWHWVLQRSGRLVPQCLYHACANFFNIFPLMLVTVLRVSF